MTMSSSLFSCVACSRRAVLALGTAAPRFPAIAVGARAVTIPFRANRRLHSVQAPATAPDAPRNLDATEQDEGIATEKARQRLEKAVYKQMDYLAEDPWHIAKYVEDALKRDAFDEALLLVQKASRKAEITVAWNHLIDHQIQKDKIKEAVKLLNDMKKRQQKPNDRTFTVIFRGLAKSKKSQASVAEAVKQYRHLMQGGSGLQANTIHLNAVLEVCSRANDMDTLFEMADTIDEGSRAATAYTYTIMFNALRHSTLTEIKELSPDEQKAKLGTLIARAKGLWSELMEKWALGQLSIDEPVVCAMGRILLLAPNPREKGEVLDIVQQAMKIPNLVKNPATDAYADESMKNIAVSAHQESSSRRASARGPRRRGQIAHAVPGPNTLGLVLQYCGVTRQTTAGIKFWNLMINHYGITPDSKNWNGLFLMLKKAKASAHVASLLESGAVSGGRGGQLQPEYFRLAMETCILDNINPNVVRNSIKVLDAMLQNLRVPDFQTLHLHLRVALVSHAQFRKMALTEKLEEARQLYGAQITEALGRLWEPFRQLSHSVSTSPMASTSTKNFAPSRRREVQEKVDKHQQDKLAVIHLARYMFSAFNKVINEKLLPDSELEDVRKTAAMVNSEIQNFYTARADRKAATTSLDRELEAAQDSFNTEGGEDVAGDFDRGRQGADFVWNTLKPALQPREPRYQRESEVGDLAFKRPSHVQGSRPRSSTGPPKPRRPHTRRDDDDRDFNQARRSEPARRSERSRGVNRFPLT